MRIKAKSSMNSKSNKEALLKSAEVGLSHFLFTYFRHQASFTPQRNFNNFH